MPWRSVFHLAGVVSQARENGARACRHWVLDHMELLPLGWPLLFLPAQVPSPQSNQLHKYREERNKRKVNSYLNKVALHFLMHMGKLLFFETLTFKDKLHEFQGQEVGKVRPLSGQVTAPSLHHNLCEIPKESKAG